MMRSLGGMILGVGVTVSTLPGQSPTQRLQIEEAPARAAVTTASPDSPDGARSRSAPGDCEQARRLAEGARGFRIVISLDERVRWVMRDGDTIRAANVGVASGLAL